MMHELKFVLSWLKENIEKSFVIDENESYFKQRVQNAEELFQNLIENVLKKQDKEYAKKVSEQFDMGALFFLCEGITFLHKEKDRFYNEMTEQLEKFILTGHVIDKDWSLDD